MTSNQDKKNGKNSEVDALANAVAGLDVKEKEEVPEALAALAGWIQRGECKRILALSGAGVSVAAGIPDFRTPGTGLYDNLQKYDLPYAEAIFDINYYRHAPEAFVQLAKELWPTGETYRPTLTHCFLALLAEKGLLLRNYSQNIDGLEFLATLPAEKLVECHGHFRTASCIQCGASVDIESVRKSIVDDGQAPTCAVCGAYVKPDIVFFGEGLPRRFHKLLRADIGQADCCLVLGTSLMVAPVSSIPEMVSPKCKRVLLNRELVGNFKVPVTRSKDFASRRDQFCSGNVDDSVLQLADLLGWKQELLDKHKAVTSGAAAAVGEEAAGEESSES